MKRSSSFFFVLLLVACGSSSSSSLPSSSSDPNEAADDLSTPLGACRALRAAVDEHERLCWGFEPELDRTSVEHRDRACAEALAAEGSMTTVEHVARCARSFAGLACGAPVDDACRTPSGTLADGAPCTASTQCVSGSCAFPDPHLLQEESACGKCAAVPSDVCDVALVGTNAGCVPWQRCMIVPSIGTMCTDRAPTSAEQIPRGASCADTSPTDPTGPRCALGSRCLDGVCVGDLGEDEACVPGVCASGLFCDGLSHRCARPILVGAGERCDEPGRLCDDGLCGSDGVCLAKIRVGAACNPYDVARPCEGLARCVDRICTLASAAACR